QQLKKGDWQEAFLRGYPVMMRPDPAEARSRIEAENSFKSLREAGPYSTFQSKEWARFVVLGGEASKFELLNVSTPAFKDGSYTVELLYRVTNDFGTGDLKLVTSSKDAPDPSGTIKRYWWVRLPMCEITKPPTLKERGQEL